MKRRKVNFKQFCCLLTIIICSGSLLLTAPTTPSPQKDRPQEYVEVVNIAMILRALKKGQPVAGLKKEDFTLYENGKQRPLTSFQEIRRKVGHTGDETSQVEEKTTPALTKKRLFFFYFQVSESDPKIQKTLDYFFQQVYREGDYALLMVENRLFRITDSSRVEPVLASFNTALTQSIEKKSGIKQKLTNHLERLVSEFIAEIKKNSELQVPSANVFISRFKMVQQEYQQDDLSLAAENLKGIASSLKKIEIEKWCFVFFQQDRFPSLHVNSIRGLKGPAVEVAATWVALEQLAPTISLQANVQTAKNLQQAFIEANVTLHLLLSNPTSMGKQSTAYLKYTAAQTDWQQAFRNISQASGGGIIKDNNFQKSMAQAVEREDVFYRLTYAPATQEKEQRNIRIQTKQPGINLQYHRKVTVSPADKITVDLFSFNHPKLEFTLKNYHQFFDGNRLYGDVELKITSIDDNGNRRTFERILDPVKEEMAISMNLDFPSGGDHNLIIEANDRQTGNTATLNKKITVPLSKYQLEPVLVTEALEDMNPAVNQEILDSLLKKSAWYCQKLKKATFYFTCTEEVIDNHWLGGDILRDDRYLYSYQIIREEDGELNENRKLKPVSRDLVKKRKKELGKAKDQQILVTNFFSNYPFLMPVSMLAKENQSKYLYRVLGTKTIAKKTVHKVSVQPKTEGIIEKDANYGVVWIDEEDGSVYKIQMDASSLGGVQELQKMARQKRNRLKVSDVHWYEVKRKGIRFPSRTEINCSFLDWNQVTRAYRRFNVDALEKMGTIFEYKKYKFFNVNVDVVETSQR